MSVKTVSQMLQELQKKNPDKVFAVSDGGTAIGVWSDKYQKFQTVLSQSILNQWSLAFDILANGKPVWTYNDALASK